MYSFHNKKQYGGLQDIRSIETAILGSLGFTPPNGNSSDPSHDWDNTLMSRNDGGLNSFGETFFLAKDDIQGLNIYLVHPRWAVKNPKE